MRVVVIGTGHVGLVTAAALAAIGHDVVGVDEDGERIDGLQRGVSPFFEPGLDDLIAGETAAGRLRFANDPAPVVGGAEVVLICVGTPARASGDANLVAVERAARAIASLLTGPVLVVEKSTVPAGTGDRLRRVLTLARPDLAGHIEVGSNPEFLREGKAVEDALRPTRILIGARSRSAFDTMQRLYAPMIERGTRLIETDVTTAELAKHACNAFLALKISYANALARLCERADADVTTVADVMGGDPRIGRDFLDAGLGYGGYCLPKDLKAFDQVAHRLGYDFALLREVARINDEAVEATIDKVREAVWNLDGKHIALLGLAFKPGTDDVRLSPALELARRLLDQRASVTGFDPQAGTGAKSEVPRLEVASNLYDAIEGAHCLVICTEWDEFRSIDFPKVKELMTDPNVVDGRNMFDPQEMRSLGFVYYGTGRAVHPRTT